MQVTNEPSTLNEALEIPISISKFDMTKIMMTKISLKVASSHMGTLPYIKIF